MRSNDCISSKYGHVGCWVDVTSHLNGLCGGRTSCQVLVISLYQLLVDCPRDFKAFLDATFQCLQVIRPVNNQCSHLPNNNIVDNNTDKYLLLSNSTTSGYLSNLVSRDANAKKNCHWFIWLQHDYQRINLTFIIFNITSNNKNDDEDSFSSNSNFMYHSHNSPTTKSRYKTYVIKSFNNKIEDNLITNNNNNNINNDINNVIYNSNRNSHNNHNSHSYNNHNDDDGAGEISCIPLASLAEIRMVIEGMKASAVKEKMRYVCVEERWRDKEDEKREGGGGFNFVSRYGISGVEIKMFDDHNKNINDVKSANHYADINNNSNNINNNINFLQLKMAYYLIKIEGSYGNFLV
ncbi:hypothetical protein HELRODRAFT_169404 [Helobdella robusta]|uniref:Uncharacterized protein n=1 Tax=Helobdella robusta TaxID=6412 RepID=T1F1W5_HELRO|nr:hypothetical protein HELRODRAFT_169404 [Helobdella robusta]ESO08537.1 hypothetical protein HELRODRAFT_169404 [Helobdella robusta]